MVSIFRKAKGWLYVLVTRSTQRERRDTENSAETSRITDRAKDLSAFLPPETFNDQVSKALVCRGPDRGSNPVARRARSSARACVYRPARLPFSQLEAARLDQSVRAEERAVDLTRGPGC